MSGGINACSISSNEVSLKENLERVLWPILSSSVETCGMLKK